MQLVIRINEFLNIANIKYNEKHMHSITHKLKKDNGQK